MQNGIIKADTKDNGNDQMLPSWAAEKRCETVIKLLLQNGAGIGMENSGTHLSKTFIGFKSCFYTVQSPTISSSPSSPTILLLFSGENGRCYMTRFLYGLYRNTKIASPFYGLIL
jgi:hypothetical protein